MLGRFSDKFKGAIYAVKAMSLIVKEVPDAKLILVSSDSGIQFLIDLIKELKLTNNVFIHSRTYNNFFVFFEFFNTYVYIFIRSLSYGNE